jgi:non-ribosomal peptide synthetase component F
VTFLLHELVSEQAARWPEALAVVCGQQALRFRDIEDRSNQLARQLREAGCQRGDRVCLLAPRGPESLVALLGILKADAIAVPLDLSASPAALRQALRLSDPRCALTLAHGATLLDQVLAGGNVPRPAVLGSLGASQIVGEGVSTSFCWTDVARQPTRGLACRNRVANPAYVIFNPAQRRLGRGTVLTHASLRRFIIWANDYLGVVPGDRHGWQTRHSEGLSIYETLGSLAGGAVVHMERDNGIRHPARLLRFVQEAGLAMWMLPPHSIIEAGDVDLMPSGELPSLRHVVWFGNTLPVPVLRAWMAQLRHVTFVRLYGATETSIASCYHRVMNAPQTDTERLPIGRPRPGEEVLVLDERLRPAVAGGIHIRGTSLSPGYWRNPEATAEEFCMRDPMNPGARLFRTGDAGITDASGNVFLAGRRENRRDRELEYGDVEAALRRLGVVRSAAVVALRSGGPGDPPVLGCAYVPIPGLQVNTNSLRAELAALLPSRLLPARWRAYPELPTDAEGGVDSDSLRIALSEVVAADSNEGPSIVADDAATPDRSPSVRQL